MRSVERTPWAERRSSQHDEMCLFIAENSASVAWFFDSPTIRKVEIEAPCGSGFCDAIMESSDGETAWFIEVKTDSERASAGDVIRQLRWYASQRRGYQHKVLVCLAEGTEQYDVTFAKLLHHAGVRLIWWDALRRIDRDVLRQLVSIEAETA